MNIDDITKYTDNLLSNVCSILNRELFYLNRENIDYNTFELISLNVLKEVIEITPINSEIIKKHVLEQLGLKGII